MDDTAPQFEIARDDFPGYVKELMRRLRFSQQDLAEALIRGCCDYLLRLRIESDEAKHLPAARRLDRFIESFLTAEIAPIFQEYDVARFIVDRGFSSEEIEREFGSTTARLIVADVSRWRSRVSGYETGKLKPDPGVYFVFHEFFGLKFKSPEVKGEAISATAIPTLPFWGLIPRILRQDENFSSYGTVPVSQKASGRDRVTVAIVGASFSPFIREGWMLTCRLAEVTHDNVTTLVQSPIGELTLRRAVWGINGWCLRELDREDVAEDPSGWVIHGPIVHAETYNDGGLRF